MAKYLDWELNFLNFKEALNYDKRTFFQYYLSLLKAKNIILFAFYPVNDYNLKIIKINIFFLSIDIFFFFNSIFFDNSTIHQIYENEGIYNFSYFFQKIIYSFIISNYVIVIIKLLSLSQRHLLKLKEEENMNNINDLVEKTKRCLIIKYILFYLISFIFITFFWYYLSSFCAVYKNTQFYVVKNMFISLGISLLYPNFFNLLPCIFRLSSLRNNKPINDLLYKISKFIQIL